MTRSNSMQVVIVVSLAAAALLGLQGCGSSAKPAPTCNSADLYVFPSETQPLGEVVYLEFDQKTCAGSLNKVFDTVYDDLMVVAQGLALNQKPEVPEAVIKAVKPLCTASCPKALVECKRGGDGESCDPPTKAGYVGLFEYVCAKAGGEGEGGGDGGATHCDSSSDLYTLPSLKVETGEVIFLKFSAEQCARDLTTLLSKDKSDLMKVAAEYTISGVKTEVPAALLGAFKPLCSAKCPEKLEQCKAGSDGKDCDKKQRTAYILLFTYICDKEVKSVTV